VNIYPFRWLGMIFLLFSSITPVEWMILTAIAMLALVIGGVVS